MRLPLLERFRAHLPITPETRIISLLEGSTPLIPLSGPPEARQASIQLYAKYEGLNPTASFKDRGMTMAVTRAVAQGAQAIACASTGNTSASAAAYAARAGIGCIVLLPAGYVAAGKVAQTLIHGARILQIEGNFDDALRLVRQLCETTPVALVNSVNPFRLVGQKTLAFEVTEELGGAPDYHALPVGNAGNITATWMGYGELIRLGRVTRPPRLLGFQAAGSAPIVAGHPIEKPQTLATAIRIGNPASWKGALAARDRTGGSIEAVTDDEILAAYQYLARHEGVFCEPASAASLAGVWRWLRQGKIAPGSKVVLTLTGHGLKDPTTAEQLAQLPRPIPATLEAVTAAALA